MCNELEELFKNFISKFEQKADFFIFDDYWYSKPYDNDINFEIDYKNKKLYISCDWNEDRIAKLPFQYKDLSLSFISSLLWKEKNFTICPTAPSIERKRWEAEGYVKRFLESCETENDIIQAFNYDYGSHGVKKPLAAIISNQYVRKAFLNCLTKNSKPYKMVYNFKMKKRYGWIRKVNKISDMSRLISLANHTSCYMLMDKNILPSYDKESNEIRQKHKSHPEFSDRFPPLTSFEINLSKEKGYLPIKITKDFDAERIRLYEYIYGKENLEY